MNAIAEVERLSDGRKIRVARAKAHRDAATVPFERDARVMNRMDPATKLVHAMLEKWGKETRAGIENGLPSTTVLGRVIEQGPGAGQAGRPISHLSEQSARVDACVARLWQRAKRCVEHYYQRWEPIEVMARREGISVTQFKEIMRRSRYLVGSWLEIER